jgi:small-conductance mechanosensitive channel
LANSAKVLRSALLDRLNTIDVQGLARTTRMSEADLATVRETRSEFEHLTQRARLLSDAILPLSKQLVTLELYGANLARWRANTRQETQPALRDLILRSAALAAVLAAVFATAYLWRRLAVEYVQDLQRRYQLLQLRRIAVIIAIALVLIFAFASELGSFATVMGFAAAGIAVALQNVILSLAGYFYLSGRYGLRVGDRVQIAGINGDVLEVGFFKLTLMELLGDERGRQPTGRAIIFPNSIVFQPTCNFFRQLPGGNFVWNELRFLLAPDCDYRLAEKRLGEVINDVYAHYRDAIQSEFRKTEGELNIRMEPPRPRSSLQLSQAGLELVLRYPVGLRNAVQTWDDIARRLIDAIQREPGLSIAAVGDPVIRSSAVTLAEPADGPASAGTGRI